MGPLPSAYYIAAEVKFTYGGMMVMVEPEEWAAVQGEQSAEKLSADLFGNGEEGEA